MKTYFEDWSLDGAINIKKLSHVANLRQSRFEETEKCKKVLGGINQIIEELEEKAPDLKKLLFELDSQINFLEMISFDAGYGDGMADLMTSIAFNKAQITKVECIDWEGIHGEAEASA